MPALLRNDGWLVSQLLVVALHVPPPLDVQASLHQCADYTTRLESSPASPVACGSLRDTRLTATEPTLDFDSHRGAMLRVHWAPGCREGVVATCGSSRAPSGEQL